MVEKNLSERRACLTVGVDPATFGRWRKKFDAEGFTGLLPETESCGRKSLLEKLNVTPENLVSVQGLNLDMESNTGAWRVFANSDRCPEELSRVILDPNKSSKHAIPPSLRAATKLTEPVLDAHRGKRQLDLNGIWIPRHIDILPGDIFVSDDTTPIWGWYVPWIESKEYPFGVKLLQGQYLPVMDVASQMPLTYALIAREKSSYRGVDILALFGHLFETVGLPRLGVQLERGSWESNLIRGQEVEFGDGDVSFSRRVGGLRQLPTNVTDWHREKFGADVMGAFPKTLQTWTSYLPKSKSIEAFFNRAQSLEGMLWGALGRDQMRRPFEKTKKLFQACQRGSEDPRKHFLSQLEMSARLSAQLDYLSNEPMEGEVFHGVPRVKFDAAVRQHPLFRLPEDQKWLYKRNWKVLPITSGWARVRLTHEISGQRYSLFYTNEIFGKIEGAQVVVYYDKENFEQPAQILAAQKIVIDGQTFNPGDFICSAEYFERKGSFLDGDQSGHDIRKAWRNAVITTYATIVPHAPSRQLPQEIAARRESLNEQRTAIGLPTAVGDNRPTNSAPMQIDGRPAALTGNTSRKPVLAVTTTEQSNVFEILAAQARLNKEMHQQP